jgi:hypothetical protein
MADGTTFGDASAVAIIGDDCTPIHGAAAATSPRKCLQMNSTGSSGWHFSNAFIVSDNFSSTLCFARYSFALLFTSFVVCSRCFTDAS